MTCQKVSIIIPAYNCEKKIGRTLEAVLAAANAFSDASSLPSSQHCVEIIVVDDGSTDNTKGEILKFSSVKYFFQENAGPAAARNRGAAESRGDILFFTDSDCLPHRDWLNLMMPHFYNSEIAVVAGSYGIANPQKRLSRGIHREIIFRHQKLMPNFPVYFGSFNFAVQKDIFQKVGGFNTGYRYASGEDNDLSYKISSVGYKIYFEKNALVDHYHPESLQKYLCEQYRHGFWRVRMYRDHLCMAKGDGYTFWKDFVEVALVLAVYLSLVLIFLGFFQFAVWIFIAALSTLLVINVVFSIKIFGGFRGDLWDGWVFSDVMVLRAFARTNGFLSGVLNFLGTTNFSIKRPRIL